MAIRTIDERKLAALFAVGRKKVRLMTPEQCISAVWATLPAASRLLRIGTGDLPVYIWTESLQRFESRVRGWRRCQRDISNTICKTSAGSVTGGAFADLVK